MQCIYRFGTEGKIRLDCTLPIASGEFIFQPETTNGIITHIKVIVPNLDSSHWPTIEDNPSPGVKARIRLRSVLPSVQSRLRTLQGLLSFYGLKKIDFETFTIEWQPESEAEKQALPLLQFGKTAREIEDDRVLSLSYDLFARAVLVASTAESIDIPLNFFRRGMMDVYERSYIEAVYDFYFQLETLFSEGKFRSREVEKNFVASKLLISCVDLAIRDPGSMIQSSQDLMKQFSEKFGSLSPEGAIHEIVELRGYLHHHTLMRKGIWHPEEQLRYEIDALFIQRVAFNVAFELAREHMWHPRIIREYESLRLKYTSGKESPA